MDEKELFKTAEILRGKVHAKDFTKYILGLLSYHTICVQDKHKEKDHRIFNLPEELLSENVIKNNSSQAVPSVKKAMDQIKDTLSNFDQEYASIFDDIDLSSHQLGSSILDIGHNVVSPILIHINLATLSNQRTNLGDAYEYLIKTFAQGSNAVFGEFYTPKEIAELQIDLVLNDRTEYIYDPTCGSGGLLIEALKRKPNLKVYGQEINGETYRIALMNLLNHGIHPNNMSIKQGDVLMTPRHKGFKFDGIVANPPFSVSWNSIALKDDPRFPILAPKTKCDYAFVQHIVSHMQDHGTAAIVLPHGVLFRGGTEGKIRQALLDENLIDTIIGLPANAFYSTSIATCLIFLKKNRQDKSILFIDGKDEFVKDKKYNRLQKDKILSVYQTREEIPGFSKLVDNDFIAKNDYNLNIPRYIEHEQQDKQYTNDDLRELVRAINQASKDIASCAKVMNGYLRELGINELFDENEQ